MEIGKYHKLKVMRSTSVGLYLSDGTDDVLLPIRYIPDGAKVDDTLEVFVYLDNEDRPVATTLEPYALLNSFTFLQVKDVNDHGAFLDWGIAKDIFVPYAEQREPMEAGKSYLVYIFQDEYSGRITGTTRWSRFVEREEITFKEKDRVRILIAEKTDLGFRAIINNRYEGMLYANELFEKVEPGDKLPAYIKKVREDKKIDLSLQLPGAEHIRDSKEQILFFLNERKGVLPLGDKSSPEEIYSLLNISKKAFKKTIGGLYKERKISIGDFEIRLLDKK